MIQRLRATTRRLWRAGGPGARLTAVTAAGVLLAAGCAGTGSIASEAKTNQGAVSPSGAAESSATTLALEPNAVVTKVIDGDTIEANIGGRLTLVRFIGIDTPEKLGGFLPAECFGDAASEYARRLIPPGTLLYLEQDQELYDRYDRLLAYVHRAVDGLHVNHELVRSGYAEAKTYGSNSSYAELYKIAADSARTAGLGFWRECGAADVKLG